MSSIIPLLASSQGRRDEELNVKLAEKVVEYQDKKALKELFELLTSKDRKLANDAIKVIYEIGYRQAKMVTPFLETLVELLGSKVNRLQWGSMTAISTVAADSPKKVYPYLTKIVMAMEAGSVITKDHGVKTLVQLSSLKAHREDVITLLMEFIQSAPVNQFPTYVMAIADTKLSGQEADLLRTIVESRLPEFEEYPPKEKKLLNVLKALN